jgi:hypothetical protein
METSLYGKRKGGLWDNSEKKPYPPPKTQNSSVAAPVMVNIHEEKIEGK